MGQIIVERRRQMNAMLREAAILVDGEKVGVVGNGKSLDVQLSPGRYALRARMDWIQSKPIDIDVADGSAVRVELSLCSAWLSLFALAGIIPYLRMQPR